MAELGSLNSLDATLRQGLAWLQAHLLNHAEVAFREVLAERPGHPLALRLHGIALYGLGRREEGIAALAAGAAGDPGDPRAWADLAVALRDLGPPEAADEAYGKAAAVQPADAPMPPLSDLVFSTERASHDFTLIERPYRAEIRYGAGRPSHPRLAELIGEGRDRYHDVLTVLGNMQADFAQVPTAPGDDPSLPFWLNASFPPLDAMALTGVLRAHDPARMIAVGSGSSTAFARRAIAAYGLRTRLALIDPEPRAELEPLCDRLIRRPLERCRADMFDELEAGDVFFLDSAHRAFQGSDVSVFFLEILPRLKPGVIVQIHDIYLPDDYIAGVVPQLWNEQYLLATALLFGAERFEIMFPSWFVGRDRDLAAHGDAMLRFGPLAELNLHGTSFWMRMV